VCDSKKRVKGNYWGEEQEQAVIDYLNSDDEIERNLIYEKYLRQPINQMAESILRRYTLHRKNMDEEEQLNDAKSFLALKFSNFNPDYDKKSFSYYGTCLRNYFLGKRKDQNSFNNKYPSYENMGESFGDDERFSYNFEFENDKVDGKKVLNKILEKLQNQVENKKQEYNDCLYYKPNKNTLKKINKEIKVGESLMELLGDVFLCEEYESIVDNRRLIRDTMINELSSKAGVNTKDVKNALKHYKISYDEIKKVGLKNF